MANEEGRLRGHEIGPSGKTVGRNIARLRREAGLSLKDLEARLDAVDRKINWSALSKIENDKRRVDADDLMALAIALNTSPLSLLLPDARRPMDQVEATAMTSGAVASLWRWALGVQSLTGEAAFSFQSRSLPSWLFVTAHSPEFYLGGKPVQLDDGEPAIEGAFNVERAQATQR